MHIDAFGREHRYGPPTGWTEPQGQQSLGPAQWDALVARGLHFDPYLGGDSHVRTARGTCLNPLIVAGDRLTVRPVAEEEQLVDGGLYVIDWSDHDEVQKYRDQIGAPSTEKILIAKFLRYLGGEWWCQRKDSLARLEGVVVAMVVGLASVEYVGSVRSLPQTRATPSDAGQSTRCSQIGLNAATTIGSGQSATAVTNTGIHNTLVDNDMISLTVSTTGQPIEIDISATVYAAVGNGSSLTTCNLKIYRDGSPVPGAVWDGTAGGATPISTSNFLLGAQVTLTCTDTPPAGSHTYTLHSQTYLTFASSGGGNLQTSNMVIKCVEIKR